MQGNGRQRDGASKGTGRGAVHQGTRTRQTEVELYAPRGVDGQTPHRRDELYVVVSGTGEFVNGPEMHPFGPGDVLFVPAATLKARRRKRIHAHLFLRGDVAFAWHIRQLRAVGHCRLARP